MIVGFDDHVLQFFAQILFERRFVELFDFGVVG
jgi:hypothetical protein